MFKDEEQQTRTIEPQKLIEFRIDTERILNDINLSNHIKAKYKFLADYFIKNESIKSRVFKPGPFD